MCHLNTGGEENRIDFPGSQFVDRRPERLDILRQSPPVNGHARDDGAAVSECGDSFSIRNTILLKCNARTTKPKLRCGFRSFVECLEEFAPGVGFGNGDSRSYAKLAQNGGGLWPARHHFHSFERSNEGISRIFCGGNVEHSTR